MAQFLILAAIDVAGLFAIWFILRARVARQLELDSLLSGVREEARALVTELNETADRNVSLVEDRMKSLRELLDETDRRMGLVRRELRTREAEREVYARLSKRRPILPSEAEASAPAEPRTSRAAPSPAARSAAEPRPATAAAPAPASGAVAAAPYPDASAPPLAEDPIEFSLGQRGDVRDTAREAALPEVGISEDRIEAVKTVRERAIELYRKGISAQIIAARVGATVAEIELMIEMEEMRPASR